MCCVCRGSHHFQFRANYVFTTTIELCAVHCIPPYYINWADLIHESFLYEIIVCHKFTTTIRCSSRRCESKTRTFSVRNYFFHRIAWRSFITNCTVFVVLPLHLSLVSTAVMLQRCSSFCSWESLCTIPPSITGTLVLSYGPLYWYSYSDQSVRPSTTQH